MMYNTDLLWCAMYEVAHACRTPPCLSAGLIRVYFFEKYAVMQRPLGTLLKALERLDWASFGLSVQASFCSHLDCAAHAS